MDKAFDVKMIADFIPTLAGYLPITLYILALSLIFGFILGVLLSLPRIYKVPILDQFARVYISFFRGTPIMVQLFIVFYGIPALSSVFGIDLSQMDPLYAAIATYALSSAATIAEVIRAGVNSVDAGQAEAAYSIGLSSRQTFFTNHFATSTLSSSTEFWQFSHWLFERYIARFFDWCNGYVRKRSDAHNTK